MYLARNLILLTFKFWQSIKNTYKSFQILKIKKKWNVLAQIVFKSLKS